MPPLTSPPRIWIADATERAATAEPLLGLDGYEWITATARHGELPPDLDLVIVTDERALPWIVPTLRACRERRIPSLHVVDGIVDWRNCFDNPAFDLPAAPAPKLFQPVFADKIACLGLMQCLVLDYLGNTSRTELTGSLRLDAFARKYPVRPPVTPRRRLLLTTARTPAFTPAQHQALIQLLIGIRDWLAANPRTPSGERVEAVWRVSPAIADELTLNTTQTSVAGGEFHEALAQADVLLTTSSTTLLEGMLVRKPTVLLDHTGTPAFVETAWAIHTPIEVEHVIGEALNTSEDRLDYQDFILRLNLLKNEAKVRTRELIDFMLAAGRTARASGSSLVLPTRILPWLGFGTSDKPATIETSAAAEVELAQLRRGRALDQRHIAFLEKEYAVPVHQHIKNAFRRRWARFLGRRNPPI